MNVRIKYLLAVAFLIVFPLAWEIQQPVLKFIGMGFFTLLGVAWLVFRSRSEDDFRIPKFLPVIVVFMVLQVFLLSITPVKATGYYWIIFELYILFIFIIILDHINSPGRRRFWENALIGAGVVYAAFDLLYVLTWYNSWWNINGSLFPLPSFILRSSGLLLGHFNALSSYLTLVTPLALVRLLSAEKRSARVFWVEILLILLVANFFTYSRGGWLALAGGILVSLVLFFQHIWTSRRNNWSKQWPGNLGKIWYIGIGLLSLIILGAGVIIARMLQSAPHGSLSARLDIYSYALNWIAASPLWGQGTGSVSTLFALRSYAIGGDEIYHAHNLWLQVTLESGLMGLTLITIALGFILWGFRSSWIKWRGDPIPRASLAAYAGAGTAILIHSLVEILLWKPAYALAVATIIALVYSLASKKEFIFLRKRITIVFLTLVLIVGSAGLVFINRSITLYLDGKAAAAQWDWATAREKLCQAAEEDPDNAFYSFQCSLAHAFVADTNNDTDALADALRYQNRALDLDPNWYIHWANLSSYEWQLGEFDAAITHMQKAVEMAPRRNFLRIGLAWMFEETGDTKQAFQSYQIAYCSNPGYQNTQLFLGSPIFQQVAREECPDEYDGLSRNPFVNSMWAGQQALADGNLNQAEYHFQSAVQAGVESGAPYAYLALVHQRTGDLEQVNKDFQTAMLIEDDSVIIHEIAGKIALSEGNLSEGYDHLTQAYLILRNNTLSRLYYLYTYSDSGLPTDISPFLPSAISNERVELYEQLAAYLADQGDHQNSRQIIQWLEITNSP